MAETVGPLVLAGGVVRVGQPGHEDDAGLLAQALNRDRDPRRGSAGDHDGAVLLDHALGAGPGRVRLGLGVAGHEDDLLAVDAVTLQRLRRKSVQHAAVTFAVDVLDRELVSPQLVGALVGVGSGLRNVEAEGHRGARGLVGVSGGEGASGEHHRRREADPDQGRALQHVTAVNPGLAHVWSPVSCSIGECGAGSGSTSARRAPSREQA